MKSADSDKAVKAQKPRWWQLYAMLPLLAGLLVWEVRLGLTGAENVIAQVVILFLVFACIHLWLRTNRRALMGIDEEQGEWLFKVVQFPAAEEVSQLPASGRILSLPEAGLKGVLSTTFQVDELEDEAAFPAGSQEIYSDSLASTSEGKRN